jgi:hypothetical protein
VYFNGTLIKSVSGVSYSASSNISQTFCDISLGARIGGSYPSNPWADGYANTNIDDVRIYNRALSVSEISALYNATK